MQITVKNLSTGGTETIRFEGATAAITGEVLGNDPEPGLFSSAGWFDVQVNGFAGTNLSIEDLQPEQVLAVTEALKREGVTTWLPTLITGPFERTLQGIRAIVEARERYPLLRSAVPGIHLEGPYISPLDGFRGAHALESIRKPDWEEFSRWQDAAGGLIRIVTVAPEIPGAIEFIRRLSASGVVAGMSHSNARPEDIAAAVEAGARFATHLGNGIAAQLHRHRNPIWAQLAEDRLFAGVIFDGFHLPPPVMQVFFRVKGRERLLLTSDAAHLARMAPGVYETTVGGKVELHANGKLTLYGSDEYLAGSASSLKDCIENAVKSAGSSLSEAVSMAAETPPRMLNLAPSQARTLFAWDANNFRLTVLATLEGTSVTSTQPDLESYLTEKAS